MIKENKISSLIKELVFFSHMENNVILIIICRSYLVILLLQSMSGASFLSRLFFPFWQDHRRDTDEFETYLYKITRLNIVLCMAYDFVYACPNKYVCSWSRNLLTFISKFLPNSQGEVDFIFNPNKVFPMSCKLNIDLT